MRHFQDCPEEVVHKLLDGSFGGQQAGEEYFRDRLVGSLTGLLAGRGQVLSCRVWPGEMVDVVSSQGHLVGLGQALAVDGELTVGIAELRRGQAPEGPGAGRAGAHLQGPGVVRGRRQGGGRVHGLSSTYHAHSLNRIIIIIIILRV